MPTRRRFLVRCSTAALAAAAAPGQLLARTLPAGTVSLDQVPFAEFANQVGTFFAVSRDPSSAIGLELVQAEPLHSAYARAARAPDARNEKFSLLFRCSAETPLEQNTYLFQHDTLGRFLMFVAPIRSTGPSHYYYQAVFNRPAVRARRPLFNTPRAPNRRAQAEE